MKRRVHVSVMVVVALFCAVAVANQVGAQNTSESIEVDNGAVYSGKFVKLDGKDLHFDDELAGEVKVPTSRITRFKLFPDTGGRTQIFYQPDKRSNLKQGELAVRDNTLVALDEDGNSLDPERVYRLEREQYSLWNFKGNLSAALSASEGNTRELAFGLSNAMTWEHPWHRIRWRAGAQYGETEGVRSTQRLTASLDYTYKFYEKLGLVVREAVEHDDFKDIEVKSVTTLGLTSPIVEKDSYKVEVEAGLTYTYETFKSNTEDRDYAGGEATIYFDWTISDTASFAAFSRAAVNFDETKDSTVHNFAALNLDLGDGFTLGIVVEHEYDNLPANPGLRRNDARLLVLLGYSF